MTPKELKKLVKMCRDMGITTYKGPDFEFTLGDLPEKPSRKNAAAPVVSDNSNFETDTLTEDQLLMWSVSPGGIPFGEQEGEQR
jgi:glutamine synthetase